MFFVTPRIVSVPWIFASSPVRSIRMLLKLIVGKLSTAKKLLERRSASRRSLFVVMLVALIWTSICPLCQASGSAVIVPLKSVNEPRTLLTKWRTWKETLEWVLSMFHTAGAAGAGRVVAGTIRVGTSRAAANRRTSTKPPESWSDDAIWRCSSPATRSFVPELHLAQGAAEATER